MSFLPVKVNGSNGALSGRGVSEPFPDFTTSLPSVVAKHYAQIAAVPFTPDVLSVAQDPLLAKKGLKYVDEMLRDDMVEAALSSVISTVLTAPRTVPADDTADAKWIADGFAAQLDEIPGGILSKLFDSLSALPYGFSVQEIGLGLVQSGDMTGWIGVKNLLYRLPHFFEFPTDDDGNLTHLCQRDSWTGATADLDLDKALYYVWNPGADPFRGRSLLRPAYEHWYAKQQFLRFRNEQGERNVGKVKVKQLEQSWKHPEITFKDYAKKVLDNYHFSRGFVELFGASIEVVTNEMSPAVFSEVIDHCNKAICRAAGVPWLAIEEGMRTGTYALGKVHQEGFLSKLTRLKTDLEELIREKLYRLLCRLNGVPQRLCPSVDMSPVLEEDKQQSVTLYISAVQAGAIKARPQDENWVRERIGLPEVDETEVEQQAPVVAPVAPVEPASLEAAAQAVRGFSEDPAPVFVDSLRALRDSLASIAARAKE